MLAVMKMPNDPVFFIAAVFFVRIYSLFSFVALISDFSILSSPLLASVALASYPLFQAIGQIPFGVLSDHVSPLVALRYGLIIFALATLGCLLAPNSTWFVIARSCQGLCALGAPAQAWLAQISNSPHQLQSRYYLIGAAIVLGLLGGFLSAAIAHSIYWPSLVFWITLVCIAILIQISQGLSSSKLSDKTVILIPFRWSPTVVSIVAANAILHFMQSIARPIDNGSRKPPKSRAI